LKRSLKTTVPVAAVSGVVRVMGRDADVVRGLAAAPRSDTPPGRTRITAAPTPTT
jgi:hypothetical protein